jgi:hypothetical protein
MIWVDAERCIGAELREPGETRLTRASCIREFLLDLLHGPIDREDVTVQEPNFSSTHPSAMVGAVSGPASCAAGDPSALMRVRSELAWMAGSLHAVSTARPARHV